MTDQRAEIHGVVVTLPEIYKQVRETGDNLDKNTDTQTSDR